MYDGKFRITPISAEKKNVKGGRTMLNSLKDRIISVWWLYWYSQMGDNYFEMPFSSGLTTNMGETIIEEVHPDYGFTTLTMVKDVDGKSITTYAYKKDRKLSLKDSKTLRHVVCFYLDRFFKAFCFIFWPVMICLFLASFIFI